ncbi:universal stress protein [Accumulibacter sp.]|uniref:universal stress protein n=1 Tax=Accumulibacter sp. TaxID=2053492 RepID=UPI0028C50AC7|nr:universal stress protein [Accumulibacter sp.]
MNPHWLLPVDGSPAALRAVEYAVHEALAATSPPAITVLSVQTALPSDITRFISSEVVHDYHRESGEAALASARAKLAAAGLAYAIDVLVGEVAPTIADFAREHGCTLIVMGSRGLGSVAGILLGSITTRVVHLSDLPVVVVK